MTDEMTVSVTVGRTITPKPFHSIRTEVSYHNVPLDPEARGVEFPKASALVRSLLVAAHDLAEAEAQRIMADQYDGPSVSHPAALADAAVEDPFRGLDAPAVAAKKPTRAAKAVPPAKPDGRGWESPAVTELDLG